MSKASRQKDIKAAVKADSQIAIRALCVIYMYQTADEKQSGGATWDNNVGFAGNDSEILTSFANQYIRRGTLSEKQVAFLQKQIGRYAGQIVRLERDDLLLVDPTIVELPQGESCRKCGGSGDFHNYNGKVVGKCFTCNGTGHLKAMHLDEADWVARAELERSLKDLDMEHVSEVLRPTPEVAETEANDMIVEAYS